MESYVKVNKTDPDDPQVETEQPQRRRRMSTTCKVVITATLVLIISGIITVDAFFPLHASCQIDYQFKSQSCEEVKAALVKQIDLWKGTECGEGDGIHQRCRYALVDEKNNEIIATHVTPLKKYIDDMNMKFKEESGDCNVDAFSTSRLWYAFLDFGTNYCNLHNLVVGTDLTNYSETTQNSICTQYTSANCSRY